MLGGENAFHTFMESMQNLPCIFSNAEFSYNGPNTLCVVTCYFGSEDYPIRRPLTYEKFLLVGDSLYGTSLKDFYEAIISYSQNRMPRKEVENDLKKHGFHKTLFEREINETN